MPPAAAAAAANGAHANAMATPLSIQHPPWFQGAPVTKLFCWTCLVVHMFHHHSNHSSSSGSSSEQQQHNNNNMFLFDSTGSLLVGLPFLGQLLRRLERELSSTLMVLWMLWVWFWPYWMTQVVFYYTLEENTLVTTTSNGPYVWIGGVLYYYVMYIPRLYPRFCSVGGIPASEKAAMYLWGIYVASHDGWSSVIPTTMGFVASAGFLSGPVLSSGLLQTIMSVMDRIFQILPLWETLVGIWLIDPPPKVYAPLLLVPPPPGGGGAIPPRGGGGGARMGARPPPRAAAPVVIPPSQDAIDQLTAMGFEEGAVRQALQATNNNVERAADRLLMG